MTLQPGYVGDVGFLGSAGLLGYVEAVMGGSEDDVSSMASAVAADFGGEALLEAAATVAIFCGLVRVADGTGIQLDEGVLGASEVWRDNAGVNGFDGAANSMHVTPRRENFGGSVLDLFS